MPNLPVTTTGCQWLTSYTSHAQGMEMWMWCWTRLALVGVEQVVRVSQARTFSYSVTTYRIGVGDCSFDTLAVSQGYHQITGITQDIQG